MVANLFANYHGKFKYNQKMNCHISIIYQNIIWIYTVCLWLVGVSIQNSCKQQFKEIHDYPILWRGAVCFTYLYWSLFLLYIFKVIKPVFHINQSMMSSGHSSVGWIPIFRTDDTWKVYLKINLQIIWYCRPLSFCMTKV